MASNLHIFGGLLGGIGVGLEKQAIMNREAALEQLRQQNYAQARADRQAERQEDRQWQKEDVETANTMKVGLMSYAAKIAKEQGETDQAYKERLERIKAEEDRRTEGVKAANAQALARLNSVLNTREDAASQRLKKELEDGQAKVVGTNPEGFIITQKGNTLFTTTVKMQTKGQSSGDEIDALFDEKPTPAPAPAKRPTLTARKPAEPSRGQALQAAVQNMMASGQLDPGTAVGEKLVAPAGALAASAVTLTWNGKRWVPD